jgi:hypothetical protein
LIAEPAAQEATRAQEKSPEIPAKTQEKKESTKRPNPQKIAKFLEISVEKNLTSKAPQKPIIPAKKPTPNEENECTDKVIIDIASCDGPVRFRRVLNEAFDVNKNPSPALINEEAKSDFLGSFKHQTKSFHQQMVRNINEQIYQQNLASEESENSQHSGNPSTNEVYTCVYCNHTFKSQYCYQKHAKRHLNPLNLKNFKCGGEDPITAEPIPKKVKISEEKFLKRDSIKPLDMNVQYYPCKTCGCKFPSYYFVHKHRKLCHPELLEENLQQVQDTQDNQNQEQNSDENKDSDSLCEINVEESEKDDEKV